MDLQGDPDTKRGGVTSRIILQTLQEALPTITEPGSIFQQDNAPVHKARLVQDWVQGFVEDNDVELMTWPPYSPDLNPIENVWSILKQRICAKYPDLAYMKKNNDALEALYRASFDVWEEIDIKQLNELVEGMPRRAKACYDVKGWYTKYYGIKI